MFTSIDLSSVKHFTCQLTIPADANPVRVRADLVSLDRTQSYSSDRISVSRIRISAGILPFRKNYARNAR